MTVVKKVFANEKQIKFLRSRAKRKTFIGGRGSGKSDTAGKVVGMAAYRMPRAKFLLAGLTYVQLDLVVLPVIRESLVYMGIHEYHPKRNPFGHYVVGVRPPEHWPAPYKPVGRLGFQYCISFITGFTLQLVSQDRPETHRGLSCDGLLGDESALMTEYFISAVLKKAIRGNIYKAFSTDPLFQIHYDFSSAAWTPAGQYIYKTEDLFLKEQETRKLLSQDELLKHPPEYLFLEATCLDNPLLGADYLERQRAESDPLEFAVEVMNERLTQLPNGFYHSFNAGKHCYFTGHSYQHDDKSGLTLYETNDYRKDKPLEISLDFNADIVWVLALQEVGREFRLINSRYTKPSTEESESLIVQAAKWFVSTYEHHERKEVYVYGDPGGNNRSAGSDSNTTFYSSFCDVVKKKGWTIYRRELTSYPRHKDKYSLVNLVLSEDSERTPRFRINQVAGHNATVIKALQRTPVDPSYVKGSAVSTKAKVRKDKASEGKLVRDRELATDSTDALDYVIWAKYRKCLPTQAGSANNLPYLFRN